jgi:hypothetical protein
MDAAAGYYERGGGVGGARYRSVSEVIRLFSQAAGWGICGGAAAVAGSVRERASK